MRRTRDHFTLIELLVVMIIAILAALLLPALGKARDKGKLAACLSHHRQSCAALVAFADDRDGAPPVKNKDNADAITGLGGTPGDPVDPCRGVYVGVDLESPAGRRRVVPEERLRLPPARGHERHLRPRTRARRRHAGDASTVRPRA